MCSGHSESAVEKVETAFSLRPLDSRTFVIKRSSNKASSSTASSPSVSQKITNINTDHFFDFDFIFLGHYESLQ